MTRDDWIIRCTAAFEEQGYHYRTARDFAIHEFIIGCHDEPYEGSSVLPWEEWPDPADVVQRFMDEVAAEGDA